MKSQDQNHSNALRSLHGDQGVHLSASEYNAIIAERDQLREQNKELVKDLQEIARGLAFPENDLDAWTKADAVRYARAILAKIT